MSATNVNAAWACALGMLRAQAENDPDRVETLAQAFEADHGVDGLRTLVKVQSALAEGITRPCAETMGITALEIVDALQFAQLVDHLNAGEVS
ncbi:hypothetical protein ACFC1T_09010 [Kitasatospora sp. NPDC056076]|uniref:hypothetical protein n=1 Tax=Kitasatospora sp. NPDC056076 TaxID=3345703 RepID=UPI0035DA0AB1